MSQMPYSPWPVAEKPVSQDRMRQILEKRTAAAGERKAGTEQPAPTATSSTVPPTAALEWGKPTIHGEGVASVFDTTKRYRVDILLLKHEDSYTCWRIGEGWPGALNLRLGCVTTSDAAKALCQADAESARTTGE
jgi:hypothetical protein